MAQVGTTKKKKSPRIDEVTEKRVIGAAGANAEVDSK
jgi:hypothetical protein